MLIGLRPAIRRAGFRMPFIPGADEAKPRLRCSRRPSALPALCLRSACAVRTSAWHRSREPQGAHEGKMPPRRTSSCAWSVRGPNPCSLFHSSVCLTDCLPAGTTLPQRLCAALPVPPLFLGLWLSVQPPPKGSIEHRRTWLCPYHRDEAGPHGTLSLPRRPCDDRSLLTLAPALRGHHRLAQR